MVIIIIGKANERIKNKLLSFTKILNVRTQYKIIAEKKNIIRNSCSSRNNNNSSCRFYNVTYYYIIQIRLHEPNYIILLLHVLFCIV